MLTSGRDRDYLRMVRDGVVLAVAEASRRARPATLEYATLEGCEAATLNALFELSHLPFL